MQEEVKEVRAKIILEGAETYRKEVEEIRAIAEHTTIAVDELNASLKKLNESMIEFAELHEKLF